MKHTNLRNPTNSGFGPSKRMLYLAMCLVLLLGSAAAQQEFTTASTSDGTSGNASSSTQSGDSDYEVKSSIEVGGRGTIINGNSNKYRSDLNYGAGVRLFDSSLLVTTKDSAGKAFDTLLITGSGWNADPNGNARISMDKTGWYNFDSTIRRYSYFNNLSNFALGQHTRNSKRNMGDFDLTILPQNENIRFRVGYSFNTNKGPAAITYDFDRDEFPIKSNFDSRSDDLRFGIDGKLLGFNLSFTEGYRRFKDNTDFFIDSLQLGNNPNPNSSFATFRRTIPETGKIFFHSLTVQRTFEKRVDFTGRIIYSESKSRFNMIEESTGTDRFGNTVLLNRSDANGDAKRPNTVGDLGLTVFVTDKFSLSNSFSVNSYRITGGNLLLDLVRRTDPMGAPLPDSTTSDGVYRFTNFRRFINTIEGDYDVNRYFSFYLGYRYTNRRVTLEGIDRNILAQTQTSDMETASNTTNSVLAGFKASPIPKKWSLYFDIEHGEADNAFTRLGNYDTTNLKVRSRFRPTNELSVNVTFQARDNKNPSRSTTIPPTAFNADNESRSIGASFDWSPDPRASISGGFSHYRVDSIAAVIFPVSGTGIGQGFSRYKLRNNFFNLDAWIRPNRIVSFFGSYRVSKDTGQGDAFSAANYTIDGNYPLTFQSPEARMTFRINNFIDWNLGYQYYDYNEKIPNSQNYSAHLPYTSLRIYFGRNDR